MNFSSLTSLGWDDFFASAFHPFSSDDLLPARVSLQHKNAYELFSMQGELSAVCTGRLLHDAASTAELPVVGDWVAVRLRTDSMAADKRQADIHATLPRRTRFSRAAADNAGAEQVVAANIDTAFLVTSLDTNFNLRRIERYLTAIRASGAEPVVVLTKADLHPRPEQAVDEVRSVVRTVPIVCLSTVDESVGTGLKALDPWLTPGATVALLGSSGVGKSTLINRLVGSGLLATKTISTAVNKGRHTTTRRQMVRLASGALVIDTPGMRELGLWNVGQSSIEATFADLSALTARCRFHDCTHRDEPDCAVRAALEDGTLDEGRWVSFQKLQREQAYAARRADPELARAHRDTWKKIHRDLRQRNHLEQE